MSFPTYINDGTGTIDPSLLTANPTNAYPPIYGRPQRAQQEQGAQTHDAQGNNNPLSFAPAAQPRDPNVDNPIFNPAQLPAFRRSPPTNPGTPRSLFGPYVRPLPHFDLDAIAEGLYERERTFPAPPNDDVDEVRDNDEGWVEAVRDSITQIPDNPTEHQSTMAEAFAIKIRRIEHRDVVVTQIAAEIVRSVIKLHTAEDTGVTSEEGMVEGEDGGMRKGRVNLPAQAAMIGDHLRADYIQDLQPTAEDYALTASQRLHRICAVLRQTKWVAMEVFSGKDWIAPLVAAPNKIEAGKYTG